MKKLFVLNILLAIGVAAMAQAKTVQAYSLKEAVDFALQYNNSVKNAKIGEEQAKARNLEIITTGLPQITGSLDYNYYFKTPIVPALSKFFSDSTSSSARVFNYLAESDTNVRNLLYRSAIESKDQKISFVLPNSLSASLQVTQLVFDARYFFGIKATKDLLKTSRLSTQLSEQEIKYTITKAYYQARTAQESGVLLDSTLKLVQKILSDTRAVYNSGLIEELDVNRLELVEANLQSQINFQRQMAVVALANLKFQMGLSLREDIILKDDLETLKTSANVAAEMKFDASQRVEYELLSTAIKLKGYDVAQKRSGYFPSLGAFLNYGWTAQTETFADIFRKDTQVYPDGDVRKISPWFSQGLVGFSLRVPIFDSGQKMAQVKQAKLEQQKTMNDLENFKNGAELQYLSTLSTLNTAIVDDANNKKALELSEKIFKKNQAKFQAGVGSSFELVQSEQDFVANQLKYMQSTMNLLNAKADLDKALGIK